MGDEQQLFKAADCEAMSLETARRLYKSHVNPALGKVLDSFDSGQVMADHAAQVITGLATQAMLKLYQ